MTIWTDLLGHEISQKYYDVNGVRTRVIEAGRGEPLIFLHGTGGHAEAYTRNIVAHAARFRVLAVDMVGHGFSDAPEVGYDIGTYASHLGDLIDVLGADRVCLSGESLGAMVATWYAIRNPSRVRKLVLNTGMLMERDAAGRAQLRDAMERSKRASGQLTRDAVHARLAWLMADPEKSVTEELVETRYRIYTQPGRAAVLGRISAHVFGGLLDDAWTEQWSNSERMRELRCPTLVIWSRHNPGLTPERARLGKDKIPDARMIVLEKSAHWPQWEEPDAFNRFHLDFLAS